MAAQGPYSGVTIVRPGEAALDKQTRKARKVAVQEGKEEDANKAINSNKKRPKKGKQYTTSCTRLLFVSTV
jgi:hypothetical protein